MMSENENIDNNVDNEQTAAEEATPKLNLDVKIDVTGSCERHVTVTIAREDVDRYLEKEYKDLMENAAIPGFRIGKAPRKLIEKRFKTDVAQRVKSNLLMDSLTQINDRDDLAPISEPDFDVKAVVMPDEGPFIYEYDVEVRPEFDIPNWKGLELKKPVHKFTDEEVDTAIERIRKNYGKLLDSAEPAQCGDYIVCSLSFLRDGNVISSSNNEVICIRPTLSFRDSEIKDFDKLMEGAVPGDVRTAKTRLSIDTPNGFLSGAEVEAEFVISKVQKAEIPELNSSFLKQIGGFETLADFRDFVKDMLDDQLVHDQNKSLRDQITNQLIANANWQLPIKLLEKQAKRELARARMEMQRNNLDDNQIQIELNRMSRNINEATAKALRQHFILEKIAEVENIDADPQDYEIEIGRIAEQMGTTPRSLRARLERSGDMDILHNQIIERKILDMIQEEAKITDSSYDNKLLDDEEALDISATGAEETEEIPDATEEDAKAAAREFAEKKHQ